MAARSAKRGSSLLPFGGDEKVDRYDVRFLLDPSQLVERANKPVLPSVDELKEEQLCDEERYRDMYIDVKLREEEEKRKREQAAKDGFHAVAFKYADAEVAPTTQTVASPPAASAEEKPEAAEEPFVPPFSVLPGMLLPSGAKHHSIIDHTAKFVQKQGEQAEVLLRVKYANNPNFGFLFLDNPLHPYYKYVRMLISEGVSTELEPAPKPTPQTNGSALSMLTAYDDSDTESPAPAPARTAESTASTVTAIPEPAPPVPDATVDLERQQQLENEKKAKRLEKARLLAKLMSPSASTRGRSPSPQDRQPRSRSRSKSRSRSPSRDRRRRSRSRSPSRTIRRRSRSRSPRRHRK